MIEEGDVVYEIGEKGERTVVKSYHSTEQVFIRFTNHSSRPINVWWRDFDGKRRHYKLLCARDSFDVTTYLSHPWEFTDFGTGERFVINNRFIFRAPTSIAHMRFRTNWNITVPVRSLRTSAMIVIAARLNRQELATRLDLPPVLVADLKEMLATMGRY